MIKQFVQVSAHKDSNNFAHCSNLSLMADRGMSATQALQCRAWQISMPSADTLLSGFARTGMRCTKKCTATCLSPVLH